MGWIVLVPFVAVLDSRYKSYRWKASPGFSLHKLLLLPPSSKMRLLSALFSLLAITTTSVIAQSANIGAPADMTQVSAGSDFTVMIERPDSLTSSTEVALVISLLNCPSSCPGPSVSLGTILYNGPFDPQFSAPEPGTDNLPPHENFTLTVPSTFTKGNAQLGVVHVYLLGLALTPELETFNTTIIVT